MITEQDKQLIYSLPNKLNTLLNPKIKEFLNVEQIISQEDNHIDFYLTIDYLIFVISYNYYAQEQTYIQVIKDGKFIVISYDGNVQILDTDWKD